MHTAICHVEPTAIASKPQSLHPKKEVSKTPYLLRMLAMFNECIRVKLVLPKQ